MNVLITGSNGFVGKNLSVSLKNIMSGQDKTYHTLIIDELYLFDIDDDENLLNEYCQKADMVFNLAGVNRPKNEEEFMAGNCGFVTTLVEKLEKVNNNCPIMISSSTQATMNNAYGRSKRAGEERIFSYAEKTGARVLVYRFPNIFGKWCRPNYNSAIATFCNNIANGLPIHIRDRSADMNLVYIDDVVSELIHALSGEEHRKDKYCYVQEVYSISLGEIVDLLYSFNDSRKNKSIPDMSDPFIKKLYATYISYLPLNGFIYDLKMNCDTRGSFTEILRTVDRGQFSVNISKPGITKGNHWHHTKNEKFVVVSGCGVIRFRRVDSCEVMEYHVSGDRIQVVDIPAGYTHNIENLDNTDMVTFMWSNEPFDPEYPDTYSLEV